MTPPDDARPPPVWAQANRGHRSTLLSQVVRVGCKAISVLVLARLLTPAEHGLYAMGATVFLFLFVFRDLGLGTAVVQTAELNRTQFTTLFWAHALLGVLFMSAALIAAPLAARFYATPAAGPLLATMSLAFLFIGLGGLPRAMLARELRFEELNFVETTAAVVGTVVMLAAGATGAGAYSFVIYLLVSEALIALLAWRVCRWRLQGRPDWAGLRELARTGQHLTGYQGLNYALTQVDTFILGRVLGAHVLGLYSRAGQLLALPNVHIAAPMTQVALAAFSRLGENAAEFRRQARATATVIAHLVLPPLAVCIALPDEIVRVVLGAQWPEAAPMLRWLAVSAGIFTATSLSYSINVAAAQSRRLAVSVAGALPFTLLGVWFGLPYGATGVAAALAGVNFALAGPRLWWVLRGSPLHVRDFLGALTGPLVVAAALGAGLTAGRVATPHDVWLVRLLAAGAGGAVGVVLLALAWPRLRAEWREAWAYLPGTRSFMIPPSA